MLHIKPVTTLSVAITTALIMACAPTQEAKNNTEPFKLPIPVATQSANKDVKEAIQISNLPQSRTSSALKTEGLSTKTGQSQIHCRRVKNDGCESL